MTNSIAIVVSIARLEKAFSFIVFRNMAAQPDKIYKCGHCGMTNDSLESLKTHMLTAHMPAQPEAPAAAGDAPQQEEAIPAQAPIDPSTSTVETAPKAPPVVPNTDKPGRYKCGHCGIIVASMEKLKSHMLTSHVSADNSGDHSNDAMPPKPGKLAQQLYHTYHSPFVS